METEFSPDAEAIESDEIVLVEMTNDGMFGMKKNQW